MKKTIFTLSLILFLISCNKIESTYDFEGIYYTSKHNDLLQIKKDSLNFYSLSYPTDLDAPVEHVIRKNNSSDTLFYYINDDKNLAYIYILNKDTITVKHNLSSVFINKYKTVDHYYRK